MATTVLPPRPQAAAIARPTHQETPYAILKDRIRAAGLLNARPSYYVLQALIAASLVAMSGILLFAADGLWLRMLTIVVMAITSAQLGFLGHDLGHRQIFPTSFRNDLVMLILNPLMGITPSWWIDAHNRHHSTPNDLELDPHTTIPILAFSEEQILAKKGIIGRVIRQQAYYFIPVLCLSVIGTKLNGLAFIRHGKARYPLVEAVGLALHAVLYVAMLLLALPLTEALLVAAGHHALTGVYFGLMFAPNHKGMPTFSADQRPDFLSSQVLTARNIRPNLLIDFMYGGLNYQIEHHLFPNMPRINLKAARPIVRAYCEERGLRYHETSILRSYAEVLGHLNRVAQVAPAGGKAGATPARSETLSD